MPSATPPPARASQTRLSALAAGLRLRGICVLHQDFDYSFDLAENVPPNWPRQDIVGSTCFEALPAEIAPAFAAGYERCRTNGEQQILEFALGEGLGRRHFTIEMLADETGVTSIVTDVTDELARDAAMSTLLREVSHRSKNLLAIVQSVAMQTANHSDAIDDFLDRFRGRLHALSSTQDLVTESNWRGTFLHALVTSQMTRIGAWGPADIRVTGANPLLGPNASLHIGLAIHELAANAVLHGALGDGERGQVRIEAHLVDHNGAAELVIEWQETGAPATPSDQEAHFGTLVLERIVPLSVGGSADFSIERGAVRYRLVVPADQFET